MYCEYRDAPHHKAYGDDMNYKEDDKAVKSRCDDDKYTDDDSDWVYVRFMEDKCKAPSCQGTQDKDDDGDGEGDGEGFGDGEGLGE